VLKELFKKLFSANLHLNGWQLPTTSLVMTVGLSFSGTNAAAIANLPTSALGQPSESTLLMTEATPIPSEIPITDGVYLYGQSETPDQLGKEYLVFETRQGKVIGAFYQPQSEFSCFYGAMESEQMSLNVVDAFENKEYRYNIALQRNATVADSHQPTLGKVELQGFQPLNVVSDRDAQILAVCRNNHQQQVWK